jgi:hypothetical protein
MIQIELRTRKDTMLLNVGVVVGNPIHHLVAGFSELSSVHGA